MVLPAASPPGAGFIASFDTLREGFYREMLVDGGITFFDVNPHLPGPGPHDFAVDDGSATFPYVPEWAPFFTSPNVLGMTGFRVGPRYDPSRFGEFKMTTWSVENFASVDVFHFDAPQEFGNSIVLEGFLDERLVARDSVLLFEIGPHHDALSISGVNFDTLRLVADGPDPERAYFAGAIDNVVITPEPGTLALLLLGALAFTRRRR